MHRKSKTERGTIYGCPVKGSPYTESLYAAVRGCGVDVQEGIWAGRWLLRHLGPGDTLHLHWPSYFYYHPSSRWRSLVSLLRFFAISSLLRLRGARIVWTAHNLYPHDGARAEWMHRLARRFLVRVSQNVFVHGPTAAAIVQREFDIPEGLIRVIPHGHWIGQLYPNVIDRASARRSLAVPEAAHVILFVGLCKPYKGLEALIDAMPAQSPGALLLIAGKFPSPEYQAAITAHARRVDAKLACVHPGYIADERLQVFLNAADVVALPYREILTSGAAVLAMSFGRPVIAPRLGSLIDLVDGDSGVLYDPDDPHGLPNALRAARATPFSEKRILERVSSFTWADAALSLAKVHGAQAAVGAAGAITSVTD